MADKVGPKELRLRELAQRTREEKNRRADDLAKAGERGLLEQLRKDVSRVAAKKGNKLARKKKKGAGR